MKFGNPFNKVALATGTFVVALMAGFGTVNAGDQFATEIEQQGSRTKNALFNQVGSVKPESVKATGSSSMGTVNSVTDVASSAQNVANITAQQVKTQADAKIADLEKKLANAGGSGNVTTKSRTVKDYSYTGTCWKGDCDYVLYTKIRVYMQTYQNGKMVSESLSSCSVNTHPSITKGKEYTTRKVLTC